MLVYLTHPQHGVHIAYNDTELAECKANGWTEMKAECDDESPAPQPVAAPVIAAPKKRGRPRKAA